MMVYNMISPILEFIAIWQQAEKFSSVTNILMVVMYQLHLIVSGELLGAVMLIVGGDKTVNMSTPPVGWLILVCENCPRYSKIM